jgi:hypothetical protein
MVPLSGNEETKISSLGSTTKTMTNNWWWARVGDTEQTASFTWRLQSSLNKIQRLHWRTSSFDRSMEGHFGKNRYQRFSFLHDILFFFTSYLLYFPEHIKRVFHLFLHLNDDHRSTIVYPSLKIVYIHPPWTFDLEQDPSFESYDVHDQSCEPHEIKDKIIPHVLKPQPSNIQDRYRPLKLPHILHYLPKFDG